MNFLILTFDIYSVSPSSRHVITYLLTSHLRKEVNMVILLYLELLEIMEKWSVLKYDH